MSGKNVGNDFSGEEIGSVGEKVAENSQQQRLPPRV
jgi:hypothetical protein